MKFFCEHFVAEILPSVRAMVARDLITRHGVSQSEAAKILGTTQPAVSQYVRRLRGRKEITGSDAVNEEVRKISDALRGGADNEALEESIRKICALLPARSGVLLSHGHLAYEADGKEKSAGVKSD
ncbi:MAG: LysR family transcriptional regulator [Candidatus Aenigmarchaeota archaeon]|nr:LysR family transcriptional regulator [Candidatus Aenigmarchaeota archaeon]